METIQYDFRPKRFAMVLGAIFFAIGTAVLFNSALTNDRGLIFKGFIDLSAGAATVFYWVLCGTCVVFVVLAILGLVRSFGAPAQVILGPKSIRAPKSGISKVIVEIPYKEITKVSYSSVGGQDFLNIRSTGAKLDIAKSMLKNKASFADMCAELERRVAQRAQ